MAFHYRDVIRGRQLDIAISSFRKFPVLHHNKQSCHKHPGAILLFCPETTNPDSKIHQDSGTSDVLIYPLRKLWLKYHHLFIHSFKGISWLTLMPPAQACALWLYSEWSSQSLECLLVQG